MSLVDAGRRRRIWTSLLIAMAISAVFGLGGYWSEIVGFAKRFRSAEATKREAFRTGLNTAAVTFWIFFPLLYWVRVPKSEAEPAGNGAEARSSNPL